MSLLFKINYLYSKVKKALSRKADASVIFLEVKKMIINLNVKVKGGTRTPVEVDVYGTAVNTKIMKFKNGKTISDNDLAVWIKHNLTEILTEIQY